jgi:methionyl-tRNA formyltransferase
VLGGETVKIWAARVVGCDAAGAASGSAGQVLAVDGTGIRVCTGEGVLCLTELQRAGGKRLPVADFLRGFAVEPGQQFQVAPLPGAAG